MSFLLDSHTFLWAISLKKNLSTKVIQILEDPENEIFVSSVTFWEISLKYSLGKLGLNGVNPQELPDISKNTGFLFLPLLTDEASGYHLLNADFHRDLFDRMLIYQALKNNLTLLNKDKIIPHYQSIGLKVIW